MASLRTRIASGFGVRNARVPRLLFAFAAVSFLAIVTAQTARAQFVCNPTAPAPGDSVLCTITGSVGAFSNPTTLTGNSTINVTPTGFASSTFATTEDGNALIQNQGLIGLMNALSFGAGNATSINLQGASVGVMQTTSQSGIATSQNAGTVFVGIETVSQNGGTAISNNTGSTDFIFTITPNGGDATTVNSGRVDNAQQALVPAAPLPSFPTAIFTFAAGATGNATVVNTGNVNASGGPFSVGLMTAADGGNATAINYGTVNSGIYTIGGYAGGNGNATTINYGTVNTGVISYSGYSGGDGNAAVFNYGRVIGGVAAYADGFGSASISNGGLIDGRGTTGQVAIDLIQNDPSTPTTLNILPGSRILGHIDLNGPGFSGLGTQVNIYGGRDISSVLTFGGGCGCGLFGGLANSGAVVNVFGAPYAIDYANNIVAVLDPSSFALQDRNLSEFSHTLSSMITSRLNNPAPLSGGSSVSSFAPSGSVAADMARDAFAGISSLNYASSDRVLFSNPSMTAADGTSVWAQGFAGQRVQDASAPVLRSVNNFYGGMLGIDKAVRPDLRLGLLLGAGNIKSNVDLNSGDTSSDIVFGGVYGRYAMNKAFFDFSLIGGHGSNDLRRNMANNLAPNGFETATASYASWFISPEIAYGIRKDIWPNVTLTPAARVRYVGAGFDGYQESGSTTNLTVASRTSHNFEERAELTLTRTSDPVPTQRMQVSGTLGALALQRAGDTTVNTILLGQNLPFATPGKNEIYGIYSGVGFDWRNNKGVTVFGAAEYTATTDSSRTATAKGGVRFVF